LFSAFFFRPYTYKKGQMNGSPSKFTAIDWLYSCTFIGCITQYKNVGCCT
jgi:hypothetical protein